MQSRLVTRIFTLLLVAFSLWNMPACKSSKGTSSVPKSAITEDHSSQAYVFLKGAFYLYQFKEGEAISFSEQDHLKALMNAGIKATDVWFKRGARSCRPPGSDMAMMVIVEPVFLVRLEQADDRMRALGYQPTESPGMGDCAYYVSHFKLK